MEHIFHLNNYFCLFYSIHQIATELVAVINTRAAWYKHNLLFLPFGNDWNFQLAERMFGNMDKLMEYINQHENVSSSSRIILIFMAHILFR